MNKENRSYSFIICNKMIDEVFKKDKEAIFKQKVMNMENCILKPKYNIQSISIPILTKPKKLNINPVINKTMCGSGYNAAKCLRA